MSEEEIRLRPEVERLTLKLEADPKSRVFAQLADAYRKSHMVDEAIEVVKKGLAIHPDYAAAHLVLGRCYLEKQIHSLAREELERAMNLDPCNSVVVKLLADTLLAQGAKAEAIQRYQQVLEMDPLNSDVSLKLEGLIPLGEARGPGEEGSEQIGVEGPPPGTPFSEEAPLSAEQGSEMGEEPARDKGPEGMAIPFQEVPVPLEPVAPEPAATAPTRSARVDVQPSHSKPEETSLTGEETAGIVPEILTNGNLGVPALSPPEPVAMIAQNPTEAGPLIKAEETPEVVKGIGATVTLAELYEEQGFYDRALELYEQVLRGQPEDQALREKVQELKNKTAPASEVPSGFFSTKEVFGDPHLEGAEQAGEAFQEGLGAGSPIGPPLGEGPMKGGSAAEPGAPAAPETGETKDGIKSFQEWLDSLMKSKPGS